LNHEGHEGKSTLITETQRLAEVRSQESERQKLKGQKQRQNQNKTSPPKGRLKGTGDRQRIAVIG